MQNEFKMIIRHGRFVDVDQEREERYRRSVLKDEARYHRAWGVFIIIAAVLFQIFLGTAELLMATILMVYIGAYLIFYSTEIVKEYRRIRRKRK